MKVNVTDQICKILSPGDAKIVKENNEIQFITDKNNLFCRDGKLLESTSAKLMIGGFIAGTINNISRYS